MIAEKNQQKVLRQNQRLSQQVEQEEEELENGKEKKENKRIKNIQQLNEFPKYRIELQLPTYVSSFLLSKTP